MQLKFLYHPVSDIEGAVTFFRDRLGFEEAWRDGNLTVAFRVPDGSALSDVLPHRPATPARCISSTTSTTGSPPTPASKSAWPGQRSLGGAVAGFNSPDGNTFYVFDQPNA